MLQITSHSSRVEQIFGALQDCSTLERNIQLDSLCGTDTSLRQEVDSLLEAADKAKGFLSRGPLTTSHLPSAALDTEAMLGQSFDSWQIVRELDSGGMGIVFLAERVDGHYQQQVAIKLARSALMSSETVSRFHTERQILANLHHPNIAQLLDGGTGPDGFPYLVLEYVKGEPIDTWCESHNLSVEDTLTILCTVCEAVQYAHRNLVVHCDLKPSNILVSEGVPKLLDFGIATLLRPSLASQDDITTQPSNDYGPLTPEFAAPEQIKGHPVTTSTDVYSLGIVLYRLLCGHFPYSITGRSRSEIAEAIDNTLVPPPSSMASKHRRPKIKGDLDKIVLKALQKDPQQRYISAQDLLSDIQRFLADFPVSVSQGSWWYRSRKFIKRHKWGVVLATLAVISLWTGSFFSAWQWKEAREKEALAEQRLTDVRNMITALVEDLPLTLASQPASTPLRVQLLDEGIDKLDRLVQTQADNPELTRALAIAYARLARLQGYPASVNLGDPVTSAKTYEKSIGLQHSLLEHFSDDVTFAVEVARNYSALTLINYVALGDAKAAHEYAYKCVNTLTPWIPNGNASALGWLINCHTLHAKWHSDEKNYALATKSVQAAQELHDAQEKNGPFVQSYFGNRGHSRIHEEWAEIEASTGNLEKALSHERKRLDIVLEHLQDEQGSVQLYGPARITADAYHAYGVRLAAVGKLIEAEDAFQHSIKGWTDVLKAFPSDASAHRSLVYIYSDYSEFHRLVASTLDNGHDVNWRIQQACKASAQSLKTIKMMPTDSAKIGKRYSFSLKPAKIFQRHNDLCEGT